MTSATTGSRTVRSVGSSRVAVEGSSEGIPDWVALERNAWLGMTVPSGVSRTVAVKVSVTSPAGVGSTVARSGVVALFQVMVFPERVPPCPGTMLPRPAVSTSSVTTTPEAAMVPAFFTTMV